MRLLFFTISVLYSAFTWGQSFPKVAEDEMVNDVHKNNIGKIFFSNKEIDYYKPDQSSFKSQFKVSDHIYARAYFPHAMVNHPKPYVKRGKLKYEAPCKWNCPFEIDLYIDGKYIGPLWKTLMEDDENKWTTRQLNLSPPFEDGGTNFAWKEAIDPLENGTYEIELRFHLERADNLRDDGYKGEIPAVASGKFTLVKENNEAVKFNVSFNDLSSRMEDANLANKVLKIANEKGHFQGKPEQYKAVKFRENNWQLVRGEYSDILLRRFMPLIIYTIREDGSCISRPGRVVQEFEGGSYSNTYDLVLFTEIEDVDCD